MQLWAHQTRVLEACRQAEAEGCRSMVVASATGTGKSRVMYELVRQADRDHIPTAVYCNRRLLYDQLATGLYDSGVTYGARASGYRPALVRDIQLAMIQTERSRVLQDQERLLHKAKRVLVDEAHLMANGAALSIIRHHLKAGATVIGFTATPVDIGHVYERLILGAGTTEGRECGALLPAHCKGPDMPSTRLMSTKVKVGRTLVDGKWQDLWIKAIFGRVVDYWKEFNPDRRPTILFAPGVKESLWFAKRLYAGGVKAAHIDAKGVWADGEWIPGDRKRQEVLQRIAAGDLEILCNRFVLREAVDLPQLYHCILATRFGSETSYIQAVGRVLRNHPSLPGHIVVTDHGGNFYLWGSPNDERRWALTDTSEAREYVRREALKKGELAEPYTCPKCFALRRSGSICPECGYVATQRTRKVVEQDGTLKDVTGKMFRPAKVAGDKHLELWKRTYWSHYKRGKTFRQAIAAFGYKLYDNTGQYAEPNTDWPFMPIRTADFLRRVRSVPRSDLVPDIGDVSNVFFEDSQQAEGHHAAQARAAQDRGRQRPLPLGG
jgi:superfamily II DNA or RNA helicase